MKSRIWMLSLMGCVLAGALPVRAAIYYVDDGSNDGDIYTLGFTGNDVNSGTATNSPKATLGNLIGTTSLVAGDIIYIDTGTYAPATISNSVNGVAGNPILFQGSTNFTAGGALFAAASGNLLSVAGDHLVVRDVRIQGGQTGLNVDGAHYCLFERIWAQGASVNSGGIYNANSNVFRRCVFHKTGGTTLGFAVSSRDNYVENCVLYSISGTAFGGASQSVSNVVGCIFVGPLAMGNYPSRGERNLLFVSDRVATEFETAADLQRSQTNWIGVAMADPKFVNAAGLDFHLLSAAGYVTNGGGWTTNGTVYSPAIDFGGRSTSMGDEPDPNGGRVNVGLYGGTAEASKSNTNDWLFAMSFNDGGTLMQTGRLEWAASTNFGAAGTVDLQYTTNNWATTNAIATGVAATNESYVWAPAFSYPAVLWRVVGSANPAVASTNAKPFSIRRTTNTVFAFYVNDASTVGDVYGMGLGNAANDGAAASRPKDTLQAIVTAYQLRGGDAIYVDTGAYPGQTTTIGAFDSGSTGLPVRIVGSPNGSIFDRGNPTVDVLDIAGASHLEIENLRLAGGRYGFNGGVTNVTLRNVQFSGNTHGAYVTGAGHVFENCVAVDNTTAAFAGGGAGLNQWKNGVMWNSPTIISVGSNKTLVVSNSILGRDVPGATLFGSQAATGDYNLVWGVLPGTHPTFTMLQDAGVGWSNSLFADPQFANSANGDFHLKSRTGRFDTNAMGFVTVDTNDSPAIDLGNPAASVGLEESPNGGRLNAGRFGGTAQASKSRTNAWIQLASYMDGGTLDAQAGAWVRWNAGAYEPGATVRIWISRDGGSNWVVLATNVSAAGGPYFYQDPVADDTSSRLGMLRVELEGTDPPASSQSRTNFTYRNGTFSFYLNDDYSTNDVYCTASGNDANAGTSSGTPMRNLHALLDKVVTLGPGDRIYVDTGVYTATNTVKLTAAFSGSPTSTVVIAGSTNRLAGGSLFTSTGLRPLGFDFQANASNIVLRNVAMSNVVRGVAMTNAANVVLDGVEVRNATSRAFDLQGNARSNQLIRCVAQRGSTGVYLSQATNISIRNCVFWENTANAVSLGGSVKLVLENSILASTATNAVLVALTTTNGYASDYNGMHAGPFTRVGSLAGTFADDLAAWIRLTGGQDVHGVPGDPQMANPDPATKAGEFSFDYHLKTEQTLGRFQPDGQRTSDSVSSPLLDAGSPASTAWTNEPAPNGGRINVGRFGGTEEASSAPDYLWIKTVSLGDAGGVTNGTVPLVWTASGRFTTETVKVEVSVDGGKNWGHTVAASVAATNGQVNWAVSGLSDTPAGAWRVVCLENTNIWAQTTNFFAIRNTNLNLFVGTADTNENVYAEGPGQPDNWVASSEAPLNSLRLAFERFDLEPGDRIWVDTGTYAESSPILIGLKDTGTSNSPIRVTGNSSGPYTRTILKRTSRTVGAIGIQLVYANGIQFDSLVVSNAHTGVHLENSQAISLDRVRVGYCVTNAVYAGANTRLDIAKSILDQNLSSGLQTLTGAVVNVHNCLVRDNALAGFLLRGGNVEVKNSILEAAGTQARVFHWAGGGQVDSDYNNIRVANGASVAGGDARSSDRFLIDWQTSTAFSNDVNSFGYEALFANESALDFHLKSRFGRFDPATGLFATNDTETSRLIDLGDPASSYANEPTNNGNRINVGLYGNTAEASKSSGAPFLAPLTMSDGGTIRDVASLYWTYSGIAGSNYVNILFSGDGGTTWTNIGREYVNAGSLQWHTTNVASTAQGVWQVVLESDTNIFGQTETLFAVKNDPLAYYINDDNPDGDVYCSEPGSATGSGLSSNSPLNSLETLLNRYKVEHGDTVYVDTGIYPRSTPLVLAIPSVSATNRLVIQGSPNEAAGGSVFTNSGVDGAVLELQSIRMLDLRDLRLHGGRQGLLFTQSSSNFITRVRAVGNRGNAFELSAVSDQNRFIQCAALHFFRTGLHVAASITQPATNYWERGVMASLPVSSNGTVVATGALLGVQSGRIYASNSVFVSRSSGHVIFSVDPSAFVGDYNVYHRDSASTLFSKLDTQRFFGVDETSIGSFEAWKAWIRCDSNSLAADPLFADLDGGDLHPRSEGGRYEPASGNFVLDDDTSPLIDTAHPAMDWSHETAPNGKRANLGLYGGTEFASRTSTTNGSFALMSFNQGGIASGVQTLRWIPQGEVFTTAVFTVYVRISTNSGVSYQTISTNPALAGSYTWDTAAYPSLPTIRWQVQCAQNLSWTNASQQDFAIRNGNLVYYVNDEYTTNDVYTSASGSSTNTGLRTNSPLASLADVLSRYDLEPGDTVRIDTGVYSPAATIAVDFTDSGTESEPVTIQGSTNLLGTRFVGRGFRLNNVRGLRVRNLKFSSQAAPPVAGISSSENVLFEQVDVFDSTGNGVYVTGSSNVWLRNFLVARAMTNGVESADSFNTSLAFGTICSNDNAQVLVSSTIAGSFVSVSNCAMGASGLRRSIYQVQGDFYANYNSLYLDPGSGALTALKPEAAGFVREFDTVGSWVAGSGQDGASLSHDPLFADGGAGDFHLKSSAGRFNPASGTFVADPPGSDSPLIDAGDPAILCAEPDPNGYRVNVGRFANTAEASKTPSAGTLTLISFNDGGRASGTNVPVTWIARGSATNAGVTVAISYSADGGSNWVVLATNVSAAAGSWSWDTTASAQTVQGKLKIEVEPTGTGGAVAQSAGLFSVRNAPFYFYVNDGSTANDVYCDGKGDNANSGLENVAPMADLNALLAKYDLEGGDVVYIDTGVYRGLNPWRITQTDTAGSLTSNPVIFQGSTNSLLNGTVLDRAGNLVGIQADYAVGFQLRNIMISNTLSTAVLFNDCYGAEVEWVAVGALDGAGFRLNGGTHLRLSRCVVMGGGQGVIIGLPNSRLLDIVYPVIDHCAIWGTQGYAFQMGGGNKATVQHSLLSVVPGQYVFAMDQADELSSDYNAIWVENGARVLRQSRSNSSFPLVYETVGAWAAASGQDLHSYSGDPLLADPAAGDFHLKSRAGRWDPSAQVWKTNDAVSSPLIDAGHSAGSWTNEPDPNGRRMNIGLFGGTEWASKSETNSALHLLSLNRGGVATGQVVLSWLAAGMATGHTVRLEVSVDAGATWTRVAEGVAATMGNLTWNSSSLPSSPLALWRVQDENEPGVEAASEIPFVLHNGPVHYYVNDESSDGDVYCGGALGHAANSGISSDSPKRWISEIVDTYDLEPGDVIHVDTGNYYAPAATTFGDLDAGGLAQDAAQQVNVVGSTNGSIYILFDPAANGFQVTNTYGIRFSQLGIIGASNGLSIVGSEYVAGDWLRIRGCQNGVSSGGGSSNLVLSHSALVGNREAGILVAGSGSKQNWANLGSCLLWSNRYGLFLNGGYARISNSIIGMKSPNSFGLYALENTAYELHSDYNNLYIEDAGAYAAGRQTGAGASAQTTAYASVSTWALASGQDVHSLPHDPLLADVGGEDYHLKSAGGRYKPGIGWTNDVGSSPLIDSGDPLSAAWTAEPNPNGRRQNIGLYGGTAEASKTPLAGWITLISLNDGGTAAGVFPLTWMVGGAATNYTICIEFSSDNGETWTNQLVCGWPAASGSWTWDSVPYGRTALGRWRATCVEDPEITATSMAPFVLRNGGTIPYFVNDSSTNGDVYCSAVGKDSNNGLTTNTPKASVQAILDTYDLDPSDVVFVDAGTYSLATPVKIDQTDSGWAVWTNSAWSNLYVTVQGSTNPAAPTTFSALAFSIPAVFSLEYAKNVRIADLTVRSANSGVSLSMATGCRFERVRVENNREIGMALSLSTGIRLDNSILWKNSTATGGVAVVLSQSQIDVNNSVLWGSPIAISLASGNMSVSNSVLDATGANGLIYQLSDAASPSLVAGDFNSFTRRNGALFSRKYNLTGSDDLYNDLPRWSAASRSDFHSMTIDPAFANSTNGNFHEQSTGGRFTTSGWTNDATLSPLVDAGSPSAPCTNELSPNGGYVNIGAYGNTREASMTQTNPPWLRAVSYNNEGVMASDVLLYWLHGGMPSNTLVQLDYSTDGMVSWKNIASNVAAGTREYLWDVRSLPLSLGLNWRVMVQNNPSVVDASDEPVRVKPGIYDYYVNDGGSTNVDVYCRGPGLAYGAGANPTNKAFPIDSLTALLTWYPVSAGDRVFVDTGLYPVTSDLRIVLDGRNAGTNGAPVKIYGSTNYLAGGTRLLGNGSANGIEMKTTSNIELYDFRISGAQNGVSILNAFDIAMERMELNNNTSNGVWSSGSGMVLRRGQLWGNRQFGLYNTASKGASILSSTLWGNRLGAAWIDKSVILSNSILCVTNAAPIFYESGGSAGVRGDYNLYGLAIGNLISSNTGERVEYRNLRDWQAKGQDAHSLLIDPLFVNPAAGNFHLQSRAGYWSNGTLAVSASNSWAIDAGDPDSSAYTNEPPPHGNRLNLGVYGGTTNASRSDTNSPALLAVSFRDGGTFSDGEPLYWAYRGILPTNTIRIDYSLDGGLTWATAVSQIRVDSAPYVWYPPADATASPEAWWRVVLEGNTNVWDSNRTNFTFRPVPLRYYVNDDGPADVDVYTTAFGSPTNRGYVSNSPLHSIQAVLDRYQLAGGDEILVDTGVYTLSNSVIITLLNSGNTNEQAKITGSTNWAAGGSRLQPSTGMAAPAFLLFGAHDVGISNFRLAGFHNGVSFSESAMRCALSDLDIQGSTGPGVLSSVATDIRLDRLLIREGSAAGLSAGSSKLSMESCVLWSNRNSAIVLTGSEIQMSNSVVAASGPGQYCYQMGTNVFIVADYNDLYVTNGAEIATVSGMAYPKLPQWVLGTLQDRHSLSTDPLFHDPANGDFHLRSVAGRYAHGTGWTNDVSVTNLPDFSPLIDLGAPRSAWSNEPMTNGSRRNIGLYGNTAQASKSNPSQWLLAVTAMSGGIVEGGFHLTWGYGGGILSNAAVQLEYSRNNGKTWQRIDSNAVGACEFFWQSDLKKSDGGERWDTSPGARWRIFLLANTNVWDMTDTYFGLHNSPFKYYLNDTSTANDVYCDTNAVGSDTNLGFYPAEPKLTLTNLLSEVDLQPTDILYVDTGVYPLDPSKQVLWDTADGGQDEEPVLCIGSTDPNGSWFVSAQPPQWSQVMVEAGSMGMWNLNFSEVSLKFTGGGIVASNLWVTNGAVEFSGGDSVFANSRLDRGPLAVSGENNVLDGIIQRWGGTSLAGADVTMRHSVVFMTNNLQTALVVNADGAVVSNCTVVASRGTAVGKRGTGILNLGHNILVAGGTDANSVIARENGILFSDWNNLSARESAWIGIENGKWERLAYWQIASGQDANSVSFSTADSFQNEAQGDFHLNSTRGRWSPALNRWDTDTVHSVLIDLGDPLIGTGMEVPPNGSRPNLGAFGRTVQASKSTTNMWVTALSHNDGGVVKGSNVVLRWACPVSAGSASFRLEYSADGGGTWVAIATGQGSSQGLGSYAWDTSGFEDSFSGLWRVLAEDDSAMDQTDVPFALRNETHAFYVNDADPTDDVYCSAIGSAANSGLSNSAPKLSLQQILDAYDLEGGDVVYLDTGSYSTNADTRIIWSRSGDSGGDVVIQGNTNSPFATVLTRSGSAPAIGIDVKASYVQLRDLNVRGTDRAIRLETNRNVTVQGVVLSEAAMGLDVQASQGAEIRNSAFWKNAIGVNLVNTRTSVLENLTFALPTLAGIQMQNTVLDTLRNNIFVPDEGAYAYSIGDSVSLLADATMDYNLYDFGRPASGFYAGATNYYSGPTNDPLRRWQVGKPQPDGFPGMDNDYRSAVTNADLAEINFEPLDFHPLSTNGRWIANATGGVWTTSDVSTSWAVDHGDPYQDFANEPPDNGGRRNIGMYGNTVQASKGDTNAYLYARTMNEFGLVVQASDPNWPWIWSAHMLGASDMVAVQFSDNNGERWETLAVVSALQEYFNWQVAVNFATAEGRWRVIGATNEDWVDINDNSFLVRFRDLGFVVSPRPVSGLMRFEWEGGLRGRRYEIRYSDDFGKTWNLWEPKYNGPAAINKSNFVLSSGQLSYVFEDRTSYLRRTRWYRIFQYEE